MVSEQQRSERFVLIMGLVMAGLMVLATAFHSIIYFIIDTPTFLIFHTLIEFASILVSFSVFIVNWESSKQNRNLVSTFVGTGFLAVASIDTMHTLSYGGMPGFFVQDRVNVSFYYYTIARLWAAWILWKAALIKPNRLDPSQNRGFLLSVNVAFFVVASGLITFLGDRLPPLLTAKQGSTWLNALLHITAIWMYMVGAVAHYRHYLSGKDRSTLFIVAALVASAISEITMIIFLTPGDVYSFVGHVYKVVAYYLIFKAFTLTSVHRPYEQLRIAKDRLEQTVANLDAKNRELDALDEVAVALGATLKPEEVLETAIDRAMQVMNASAGAIFLLEDGTEDLKLVIWRGLQTVVVNDLASHTIRLGCYQNPSTLQPDVEWLDRTKATVRRLGGVQSRIAPFGACMCAPIVNKGKLLGSIAMVAKEGRRFSQKDTNLLTAIGYQFGLAIENARLYEQTDEKLKAKIRELQRAERRSRFLYEIGALLASGAELDEVLDQVARKSAESIGSCCAIYLLDELDEVLRLKALYCREEKERLLLSKILSRHPIPFGQGFIGLVALSEEPAIQTEENRESISEELLRLAESSEEKSLLRLVVPMSRIAAPIRVRGRSRGVLVISSNNHRQLLGEADLSLVAELASRTGVAIENRQLLQESQSQRRHLEAIISQMVDGVVVTDKAGNWLEVNASARNMLVDRGDVLLGSPSWVGVRGDSQEKEAEIHRENSRSIVERALSGELVIGEEIVGAGLLGKTILSASASPVYDDAGNIMGAVVVLRDVTANREVEKIKDEFVATTSHELRTPITAVMGYTDLLLKGIQGPLTSKQRDALEAIRAASKRLLRLVNDLLDISRLEAGRQEIELTSVELGAVVKKAFMDVAMLADAKKIAIKVDISPNLPLVLADEEHLQRILGNLLSNAIKFTDKGGKVTLSAFVGYKQLSSAGRKIVKVVGTEDEVAITVTDTGIGIPPEYQDKIWDKFQQVDSSSRRLFGGTGLGLAITKRLVELHGGNVWVESEGIPGRGSTFGFTLKVAKKGG